MNREQRRKQTKAELMAQRPNIPTEDAKRLFEEACGPNGWLAPKGVEGAGNVIYGFKDGIDVEALGRYLEKEVKCAEREAP